MLLTNLINYHIMMKLYNILFYYSYLAGMRSHNFEGMPVLAGLMMIIPNFSLHVATIIFLLETLGIPTVDYLMISEVYTALFFSILAIALYIYYSYKGRYRRVIDYYDEVGSAFWKRHPVLVYAISVTLSGIVFFIIAIWVNENYR